jgi:hypothetical protein
VGIKNQKAHQENGVAGEGSDHPQYRSQPDGQLAVEESNQGILNTLLLMINKSMNNVAS